MENGNYYGNISKAQLGKMEMLCFQKMYKKEPIETRIQRLETNVFGTIQSGNLNNRFKKFINQKKESQPAFFIVFYINSDTGYCKKGQI